MILNSFKSLLLISVLALGAGCSKNGGTSPASIVTDLNVSNQTDPAGDIWVQVQAVLNTGGFMMLGLNLPIVDPNDHVTTYGRFTVVTNPPSLCQNGGYCADLSINVNLTAAAGLQSVAEGLLPNGTPIPVGGWQPGQMITLPIGETGGRIYVALAQGLALLGTAIPFTALDPAGTYVPGVNIFQPIQAGPINLVAGMFFGAQTNTTGFGFFIDLSNVLPSSPSSRLAHLPLEKVDRLSPGKLEFRGSDPSDADRAKMGEVLYQLNQKKLILKLKPLKK